MADEGQKKEKNPNRKGRTSANKKLTTDKYQKKDVTSRTKKISKKNATEEDLILHEIERKANKMPRESGNYYKEQVPPPNKGRTQSANRKKNIVESSKMQLESMKNVDVQITDAETEELRKQKRFLINAMEVAELPGINTNDAAQMWNRTLQYFSITGRNNVKPTMTGLALAYGVSREQMLKWIRMGTKPKDVMDILEKAYAMMGMQMEDYMQQGQINPVSGIFLMKNSYGYTDKQEMVLKAENPFGNLPEQKQLEEAFATVDDD